MSYYIQDNLIILLAKIKGVRRQQGDLISLLTKIMSGYADRRTDAYGYTDREQGDLISLLLFLVYFPKVGLYDLHAVYVSVYPALSTFECHNQSL
jgi:hypothetical protein